MYSCDKLGLGRVLQYIFKNTWALNILADMTQNMRLKGVAGLKFVKFVLIGQNINFSETFFH